jgi:hypothetical protein
VVLRLRGLSKPSREKRATRVQQISDWIEGNGDRVTLALAETNVFCLLGFQLLLNAFVGFVAVIVTRPSRPFVAILEALTLVMVCLFGFLYMTTGLAVISPHSRVSFAGDPVASDFGCCLTTLRISSGRP